MSKKIVHNSGILIKGICFIICFSVYSYSQKGASGMPQFDLSGLMSEALHQAIGLEKLPDVRSLLNRDTVFVVVYESDDSISSEGLSGFLPAHIDVWKVKSIDANAIKLKDRSFYYLRMFLEQDGDKFIVDFICQPNYEDFIDRGLLRLEFKFEDGVFTLVSLSRGYG